MSEAASINESLIDISVTLLQSRSWVPEGPYVLYIALHQNSRFRRNILLSPVQTEISYMKQLLRQPNGSSRSERCERMRVMFGQATHLWVNERMWRGRCSRVAWAEYRAPESAKLFSVRNSNRRLITEAVAYGNGVCFTQSCGCLVCYMNRERSPDVWEWNGLHAHSPPTAAVKSCDRG